MGCSGGTGQPCPLPPSSPGPGSGEVPAARPYLAGGLSFLGSAGETPASLGREGAGGSPPGSGGFLPGGRRREAVPARGRGLTVLGVEQHPQRWHVLVAGMRSVGR